MVEGKTDRNKEVVALCRKGLSLAEIGKKFNLSRQRVYQIYKRNSTKHYKRLLLRRQDKWKKHRTEIMEMLHNGMSQNQVARKEKISVQRVRQIIKYETRQQKTEGVTVGA